MLEMEEGVVTKGALAEKGRIFRRVSRLISESEQSEGPNSLHAIERRRRCYSLGRVLHFKRVGDQEEEVIKKHCACALCCSAEDEWVGNWVDFDEACGEIIASPSMLLDHFPDRVFRVINEVAAAQSKVPSAT